MKLSEHFDSSEFACKCGCGGLNNGANVNPKLVNLLENIRGIVNRPIFLSNAYRCPEHNKDVGGVANSQHIYGNAADIIANFNTPEELYQAAELAGADGLGIYPWGIHVDVRGYKARW